MATARTRRRSRTRPTERTPAAQAGCRDLGAAIRGVRHRGFSESASTQIRANRSTGRGGSGVTADVGGLESAREQPANGSGGFVTKRSRPFAVSDTSTCQERLGPNACQSLYRRSVEKLRERAEASSGRSVEGGSVLVRA